MGLARQQEPEGLRMVVEVANQDNLVPALEVRLGDKRVHVSNLGEYRGALPW